MIHILTSMLGLWFLFLILRSMTRTALINLQRKGGENALYPRSVYRSKVVLQGLSCHPLTCMLLKVV